MPHVVASAALRPRAPCSAELRDCEHAGIIEAAPRAREFSRNPTRIKDPTQLTQSLHVYTHCIVSLSLSLSLRVVCGDYAGHLTCNNLPPSSCGNVVVYSESNKRREWMAAKKAAAVGAGGATAWGAGGRPSLLLRVGYLPDHMLPASVALD